MNLKKNLDTEQFKGINEKINERRVYTPITELLPKGTPTITACILCLS
jgi:hypothetical protein